MAAPVFGRRLVPLIEYRRQAVDCQRINLLVPAIPTGDDSSADRAAVASTHEASDQSLTASGERCYVQVRRGQA